MVVYFGAAPHADTRNSKAATAGSPLSAVPWVMAERCDCTAGVHALASSAPATTSGRLILSS
jgi:hypothetical protein